jgi:hypothetical protein
MLIILDNCAAALVIIIILNTSIYTLLSLARSSNTEFSQLRSSILSLRYEVSFPLMKSCAYICTGLRKMIIPR